MPPENWLETYRGTVYRWEVDNFDHLTVAFYMERFGDAARAAQHALGLPAAAASVEFYIRYARELRVGDLMHVETAVIGVEPDGLRLGHKMFDSAEGTLCTTVEHRLVLPLTAEQRRAAEARRVAWDGPAREARPRPATLAGFLPCTRDIAKAEEVEDDGHLVPSAAIHRFSAANGHVIAAFGFTPRYMREENRGFSTFEFQLEFMGGVRAGDPLVVHSALTHVGNSSMRIVHALVNERTGARVAALEQSGVQLDLAARRPAPLPPELRNRAQKLLVLV